MSVGGVTSIEALVTTARQLRDQMHTAEHQRATCIDAPDVITHVHMRTLRRDAKNMLLALSNAATMPGREQYPEILVADADHQAPARKNALDALRELIASYENSIFIHDGGKIIYQKRPKGMPMLVKMYEQTKDCWVKLYEYGRMHPTQFIIISSLIIALKILFAVLVFGAIEDSMKHLVDRIRGSHSDDKKQQQPAATASSGS